MNVVGSTYKLYRNVNKIAGKKYLKKTEKEEEVEEVENILSRNSIERRDIRFEK